jgi:Uncharacterized protein conserved in archaea
MAEPATQITLIGTKLATIGMEFIFNGPTPECESCKLRNTCMNLEPGRRYRILGIKGELVHECPLHEEGCVPSRLRRAPRSRLWMHANRLQDRR